MSNIVDLPVGLDLSKNKPLLNPTITGSIERYRSSQNAYAPLETCRIEIPTSGMGKYLHQDDSFLEFKVTFTFTAGTASTVNLDSSIYSILNTVRVVHGSNLLYNLNDARKLYNVLREFGSFSHSDCAMLGTNDSSFIAGKALTTNTPYTFCCNLPISALGTLTDKSLPLSMMNSTELALEIDFAPINVVLCNRTASANNGLAVATGTTLTTLTTYSVTEVYFNAKISTLPYQLAQAVQMSYGAKTVIPSLCWANYSTVVTANASSFSTRIPCQYSSVKGILFFFQNASIAGGNVGHDNFNFQPASSHRVSGDLRDYWVSVDGRDYPSSHVELSGNNAVSGARSMAQVKRFFNTLSAANHPVSVRSDLFESVSVTRQAIQTSCPKWLGALDFDRVGAEQSDSYMGINTLNSIVQFNCSWNTAPAQDLVLDVFILYDHRIEIENGVAVSRY